MRTKILITISSVIALISVVTLIVFASIKTTGNIKLTSEYSITIYNRNQSATKKLEVNSQEFQQFNKLYQSCFSASLLSQLLNNGYLSDNQVENLQANEWSDLNKLDGLFAEFNFKTPQRLVVYRNGNSRQLYITSLIFEILPNNSINAINFYYAIDGDYNNDKKQTGDDEIFYPIICYGNTSKLYEFANALQ